MKLEEFIHLIVQIKYFLLLKNILKIRTITKTLQNVTNVDGLTLI